LSILDIPAIVSVRRNHALEHATMHVLARHHQTLRLVGRSSLGGFHIYGQVDTEALASAASEALVRLQNGERELPFIRGVERTLPWPVYWPVSRLLE
jgi:hypothetical protein